MLGVKYMKTTRAHVYICRTAFIIGLFCTACCFVDSWHPQFFWSIETRIAKTVLCFAVPLILTVADYIAEKNLKFVGTACAVIMNVCFVLFFIDRWTVNLIARIGDDKILFHFMYSMISFFTVLAASWLCVAVKRDRKADMGIMLRRFSLGYLPLCALLFFLMFFALREFDNFDVTANLIPFKGEIGCLIYYAKHSQLTVMLIVHSAGNVLYFTALALVLCGCLKKHRALLAAVIPVALSVFIETFQYITKSGDADIDDIILNSLGTLIGVLIYIILIKPFITEDNYAGNNRSDGR